METLTSTATQVISNTKLAIAVFAMFGAGAVALATLPLRSNPTPNSTSLCIDTDDSHTYYGSGINLEVQGTASGIDKETGLIATGIDICLSKTLVKEYYCTGDYIKNYDTWCPSGKECMKGACVKNYANYEGVLEIYFADNFKEKTSQDYYALKVGNSRFSLEFDKNFDKRVLVSGAKVSVRGLKTGNQKILISNIENIEKAPVNDYSSLIRNIINKNDSRKIAVIMMNFSNKNTTDGITSDKLKKLLFTNADSINNIYKELTFNKIFFAGKKNTNGDYYGWYTLPFKADETCTFDDVANWQATADNYAKVNGFKEEDYDHIIYVSPYNEACSYFGALGNFNNKRTYFNSSLRKIYIVHELGHNLGLTHSWTANCRDDENQPATMWGDNPGLECIMNYHSSDAGSGIDMIDPMGPFSYLEKIYHFGGFNKIRLGILGQNNIKIVDKNNPGEYVLANIENQSTKTQVILIPKKFTVSLFGLESVNGYYYIEYRNFTGLDKPLLDVLKEKGLGVYVRLADNYNYPVFANPLLLDFIPEDAYMADPLRPEMGMVKLDDKINLQIMSMTPEEVKINITFVN